MRFATRIATAWVRLAPPQRLAALAAIGLLVTMFMPWYGLQDKALRTRTISAFGDVSFVEGAIFLVAAGVLVMLFARAERRSFHLPGGDGSVITAAGAWAAVLLFYRVFSRPDGGGYPVSIEWGFFLAFVAAASLALAGWRLRNAHVPEPPGADGSPQAPKPRSRPRPQAGGRQLSFEDDPTTTSSPQSSNSA
ncbi:MAG TPA: hypothetical protein VFT42_01505 [Solirubrobacteraceae bacterium]|nr:hypothetical protein [Solirubrobacteraceae bacterium]